MFNIAVACSDDVDTDDALKEVFAMCDEQLAGSVPNAGIVFCGTEFDHQLVVDSIMQRFPDIQLVGCTTDGEMSSCEGFTEDAITLTLLSSDSIEFSAGFGRSAGSNPLQAAMDAVNLAKSRMKSDPKLALIMPDGLTANAYEVLDGFNQVLGMDIPVVGGMSADRVVEDKHNWATYQFYGNQVLTDSVPVLLYGGSLIYSLGVESGWSPVGKKARVTHSDANILYELDNEPAFNFYTHYLGDITMDNMSGLGSYPLAVYEEGINKFYLRVARNADPVSGTITFLGEIPEGAEVQITQAIRDEVIGGVSLSAESAISQYPGKTPAMAMMFSCTGRKIALGTKTRDEVDKVRSAVEIPIPMSGFYTFGEIGPVSNCTRARYHNTTFVTLLLGEE